MRLQKFVRDVAEEFVTAKGLEAVAREGSAEN